MAELAPGGVKDLVSTKSTRYKELDLGKRELTEAEWLDLLAEEPKLLRRPLIMEGARLVIGYDEAGLRQLGKEPNNSVT